MLARVIYQDDEIRKKFYQKIKEKVEKERQKVVENDNSGFLAKLLRNTEVDKFDRKVAHDNEKGSSGEKEFETQMWLLLKGDSYVLPDYVFQISKDEFIQIDNIVINKRGIFLVEIKTWSGSFVASDKVWKMRQGKDWVAVENPTAQHNRHFKLFNVWLQKNLNELYQEIESVVYPVIVLKQVDWIKSDYSSIPVVSGAMGFIGFILEKPRNQLSAETIELVVEKLRAVKPLNDLNEIKFTEGKTKSGKRFVKVEGSKDDAQKVAENYKSKYKIGEIYPDKFKENSYFFYIEEN
uniref:NERD domain-containing protein n=1 Tax=Dictyoglomus turgidum TaxID=513050 RepID=A0A7C3SNF5_9BACT